MICLIGISSNITDIPSNTVSTCSQCFHFYRNTFLIATDYLLQMPSNPTIKLSSSIIQQLSLIEPLKRVDYSNSKNKTPANRPYHHWKVSSCGLCMEKNHRNNYQNYHNYVGAFFELIHLKLNSSTPSCTHLIGPPFS